MSFTEAPAVPCAFAHTGPGWVPSQVPKSHGVRLGPMREFGESNDVRCPLWAPTAFNPDLEPNFSAQRDSLFNIPAAPIADGVAAFYGKTTAQVLGLDAIAADAKAAMEREAKDPTCMLLGQSNIQGSSTYYYAGRMSHGGPAPTPLAPELRPTATYVPQGPMLLQAKTLDVPKVDAYGRLPVCVCSSTALNPWVAGKTTPPPWSVAAFLWNPRAALALRRALVEAHLFNVTPELEKSTAWAAGAGVDHFGVWNPCAWAPNQCLCAVLGYDVDLTMAYAGWANQYQQDPVALMPDPPRFLKDLQTAFVTSLINQARNVATEDYIEDYRKAAGAWAYVTPAPIVTTRPLDSFNFTERCPGGVSRPIEDLQASVIRVMRSGIWGTPPGC